MAAVPRVPCVRACVCARVRARARACVRACPMPAMSITRACVRSAPGQPRGPLYGPRLSVLETCLTHPRLPPKPGVPRARLAAKHRTGDVWSNHEQKLRRSQVRAMGSTRHRRPAGGRTVTMDAASRGAAAPRAAALERLGIAHREYLN
jgi:hypothetical protein